MEGEKEKEIRNARVHARVLYASREGFIGKR
nr:MAG TPA: hypothetical protein [Caudoviricetes sp.]